MAIKTFKHKGLRAYFETGNVKGIKPAHAARLSRLLYALNRASEPNSMNFPGNDFHKLKGDYSDFFAVSVKRKLAAYFYFRRYRCGASRLQGLSLMKQHFVPHPGSLLREDILPALGLTVTEAAGQLGVSRSALTRLINEHAAVSAEIGLASGAMDHEPARVHVAATTE